MRQLFGSLRFGLKGFLTHKSEKLPIIFVKIIRGIERRQAHGLAECARIYCQVLRLFVKIRLHLRLSFIQPTYCCRERWLFNLRWFRYRKLGYIGAHLSDLRPSLIGVLVVHSFIDLRPSLMRSL